MKHFISTRAQGTIAEDTVAAYLLQSGYQIIKRNIFTPFGEIDILAKQESEYVCVEVRSRSKITERPPELSLNYKKYRHLVKSLLSLSFLDNKQTRIDLVTVEAGRVRKHFRDVNPI